MVVLLGGIVVEQVTAGFIIMLARWQVVLRRPKVKAGFGAV